MFFSKTLSKETTVDEVIQTLFLVILHSPSHLFVLELLNIEQSIAHHRSVENQFVAAFHSITKLFHLRRIFFHMSHLIPRIYCFFVAFSVELRSKLASVYEMAKSSFSSDRKSIRQRREKFGHKARYF